MDFFIANISYVAFRLFVTGNVILLISTFLKRFMRENYAWYTAVFIMAQLSFWYDYLVFSWTLFKPA